MTLAELMIFPWGKEGREEKRQLFMESYFLILQFRKLPTPDSLFSCLLATKDVFLCEVLLFMLGWTVTKVWELRLWVHDQVIATYMSICVRQDAVILLVVTLDKYMQVWLD